MPSTTLMRTLKSRTSPQPGVLTQFTHRSQIEPLWHSWISYAIDTPPNKDPLAMTSRPWAPSKHIPNQTFAPTAFRTYNTFVTLL